MKNKILKLKSKPKSKSKFFYIILIILFVLSIFKLNPRTNLESFSAWKTNPSKEALEMNKFLKVSTLTSDNRPNLLFPSENSNINNYARWKIDLCERWQGHENITHNKMVNFLKNLKDNDIIVDAGSHVGDTGLLLALELKKIGKKCKIYEIDPNKSKLDFINKIAEYNKLNNIKTIHCGLDSKISKAIQNENTHAGAWSVIKKKGNNEFNLYPLDNLIQNEKVGLIHFDLEGMEYEALKGSINIIKKYKPAIMMEVILGKHDKAQEFIDNLGYKQIWKGEKNTFNIYK